MLGGLTFVAPALASDPKKESPKPAEKEIKYVNEAGAEGRAGNIYKRVEREKYDEPQLKAKEPPAPPPEPEAKGDGKKAGKVEILFHGATELGLFCGTPADLTFAMMTLQALGIKTPAVPNLTSIPGSGQPGVANFVVPFRANPTTADPVYSESSLLPTPPPRIPITPLTMPKSAQGFPLNDPEKRIVELEGIINGLKAELEAVRKGAGK